MQKITGFDYYTCNTREKANARSAKQSNLAEGVHIFVRTREDGVGTLPSDTTKMNAFNCSWSGISLYAEEYRMPITIRHLSRYLRLRGVAGNPANVLPFESEG